MAQATETDNSDLDDIEARIVKVNNAPSPEGGWLTYFDIGDIEWMAAELRAARQAMDAISEYQRTENWCPICVKSLFVKHPDRGWKQGHKPNCPLAAYDALRTKTS